MIVIYIYIHIHIYLGSAACQDIAGNLARGRSRGRDISSYACILMAISNTCVCICICICIYIYIYNDPLRLTWATHAITSPSAQSEFGQGFQFGSSKSNCWRMAWIIGVTQGLCLLQNTRMASLALHSCVAVAPIQGHTCTIEQYGN